MKEDKDEFGNLNSAPIKGGIVDRYRRVGADASKIFGVYPALLDQLKAKHYGNEAEKDRSYFFGHQATKAQ